MSLSTQLTRGTLALPMLALFGVLALLAGRAAEAETIVPLAVPVQADSQVREISLVVGHQLALAARIDAAACAAHARPQMLLAQAPGDLGPIAQREGAACRS